MADLTENLKEILARFFTAKEHFEGFVHQVKRQDLESALTEVLDLYARDKNSSTLREFITVTKAGYKWRKGEKLGPNGLRKDKGTTVEAEAKPKNVNRGTGSKLNGGGNFSDLTPKRFAEYKEQHLNMLVSCFVDGELAVIVEFPFNCPQFTGHIHKKLEKEFPGGKRIPGRYKRSLEFNWNHYNECNVHLIFLNRELVEDDGNVFTRGFKRWVLSLSDGEKRK